MQDIKGALQNIFYNEEVLALQVWKTQVFRAKLSTIVRAVLPRNWSWDKEVTTQREGVSLGLN